ncbi:MAG TPA: hypothetical protein VMG82_18375 [Candidatus Sulfotelmatobacter sp.]|nr:hypothetical protein [Candidatus Sulfotelmatobacter sp.]
MKVLRSYTEAFEPEKVASISRLIDELDHLSDFRTGYKLYTSEIQGCLTGGLLLAAGSVSCALLELFVRDLTVAHRVHSRYEGDMRLRGRVEREIEGDRHFGFSEMLKELQLTVITPGDATKLREFYDQTRIPLAHALVRRPTSHLPGHEVDELDDLFSDLARRSSLEDRLEEGALIEVGFVIGIMKTYQPWLLRRYGNSSESEGN